MEGKVESNLRHFDVHDEKRKTKTNKKCRFQRTCSVILIPSRKEYVDACIDLWYTNESFELSKLQVSMEMNEYMTIHPDLSFEEVISNLYQPVPSALEYNNSSDIPSVGSSDATKEFPFSTSTSNSSVSSFPPCETTSDDSWEEVAALSNQNPVTTKNCDNRRDSPDGITGSETTGENASDINIMHTHTSAYSKNNITDSAASSTDDQKKENILVFGSAILSRNKSDASINALFVVPRATRDRESLHDEDSKVSTSYAPGAQVSESKSDSDHVQYQQKHMNTNHSKLRQERRVVPPQLAISPTSNGRINIADLHIMGSPRLKSRPETVGASEYGKVAFEQSPKMTASTAIPLEVLIVSERCAHTYQLEQILQEKVVNLSLRRTNGNSSKKVDTMFRWREPVFVQTPEEAYYILSKRKIDKEIQHTPSSATTTSPVRPGNTHQNSALTAALHRQKISKQLNQFNIIFIDEGLANCNDESQLHELRQMIIDDFGPIVHYDASMAEGLFSVDVLDLGLTGSSGDQRKERSGSTSSTATVSSVGSDSVTMPSTQSRTPPRSSNANRTSVTPSLITTASVSSCKNFETTRINNSSESEDDYEPAGMSQIWWSAGNSAEVSDDDFEYEDSEEGNNIFRRTSGSDLPSTLVAQATAKALAQQVNSSQM